MKMVRLGLIQCQVHDTSGTDVVEWAVSNIEQGVQFLTLFVCVSNCQEYSLLANLGFPQVVGTK